MVSTSYHQKRERFLDGMDRFAQFVGVLGGAAAFSLFLQATRYAWLPGAVVAVVSASALCYAPGGKARRHGELARDFSKLHAEIVRAGNPLSEERRNHFNAEILVIQAQEPAALRCLVRQVENELLEAFGYGTPRPLCWWDRLWMNVVDLDPSRNAKPPPAVSP
jgi:hypothetical protein